MARSSLRQPSIRVKYAFSTAAVESLGVVGLRCRVPLYAERFVGPDLARFEFIPDSGASYSFMSLDLAESEGIPVPPPHVETTLALNATAGPTAMRVRPGRLRFWWTAEQAGYRFDWPILFRVDAPPTVPPVLGLGGTLLTSRWAFDGLYAPDAPYGALGLDDTR